MEYLKEKVRQEAISRNIGESIHIGDDVKLTVLEHDGGQVRIWIDAPKSVSVHREEIYYRVQQSDKDGMGIGRC